MTIVSFESLKADKADPLTPEQADLCFALFSPDAAVPWERLRDAIQHDSFTTEEVRLIVENPATARVFMSCYRANKWPDC